MEAEFYNLSLIVAIMLGASYIQSTTGFGFGIFAMIFLPSVLLYTEANVLSTMLSILTSALVCVSTFKNINWRNLFFPLLGSLAATQLAVNFIKVQKSQTLTLLLGIALLVLSIYFFFFSGKIKINPTWYAGLIAGIVSGIMSGMFAIGGPPVVIYYLHSEKDTDDYLATISAYFVFSGIISVAAKARAGFITPNVWIGFAVGLLGMLVGAFVGKLTRDKANATAIKKAVYAVMALSGIVNIATALL